MTLICLALGWLVGIVLGAAWVQPWPVWAAVAASGAAAALLGTLERTWRLGGATLALLALGALRVSLSPLYATPLQPYLDGPPVTLVGIVSAAPDVRAGRTELELSVSALVDEEVERPLHGRVRLRVPRASPYRYGDRLRVLGQLRTPSDGPGFSYRAYLARRGIHGLMEGPEVEVLARGQGNPVQAALIALADRAEALIHTLWPAPESGLLAGILLGRERAIPEPLLATFDDTGTRHIIAISGFNITLLAGVLTGVLVSFLNRRVAAPIVILLLAFYVALAGGDPAVVRAGLMGGLTLLALLAGRPAHALTGLAASALAMTAWNPWTLWETGFQLSFAATLGLIILVPRLEGWVASALAIPVPRWLREALLVSLAAQIATLPITVSTFGRLSLVAPIANLLILPAQVAVMELGALATFLAFLWRPAGQAVAWLAWPFTAYTIRIVQALGSLPWAAVDLRIASFLPGALYTVGGFTLWARANPERRQAVRQALTRHLPAKAILVGLVAANAFLWTGVARAPDGKLHVTFLDVGQGDAIFIRAPDGKQALIDGGPDPTILPAAVARRLAPWERDLDLVAITHPDEDHLAGLVEIARRYHPGLILDTRLPHDTPTGQAWAALSAPHAARTPYSVSRTAYPTRGTTLDLGSGVRLQVLHPGPAPTSGTQADENNNGLVLRLSYGRTSFLLTGDLEAEGEAELLRQAGLPLQATVLKVAHHGAKQATTRRFLEAVRPQVAVISVGAGNHFGHPAPAVLERLAEAGVQVWRTDECGDVEIVTDGESLWVRTGRCREAGANR